MESEEHSQLDEWDVARLESTLKAAKTRLPIAVGVAIVAAIVGFVGLAMPGYGPIVGLSCLIISALALSYAIRQRAKRDYCVSQLQQPDQHDSGTSAQTGSS